MCTRVLGKFAESVRNLCRPVETGMQVYAVARVSQHARRDAFAFPRYAANGISLDGEGRFDSNERADGFGWARSCFV